MDPRVLELMLELGNHIRMNQYHAYMQGSNEVHAAVSLGEVADVVARVFGMDKQVLLTIAERASSRR